MLKITNKVFLLISKLHTKHNTSFVKKRSHMYVLINKIIKNFNIFILHLILILHFFFKFYQLIKGLI